MAQNTILNGTVAFTSGSVESEPAHEILTLIPPGNPGRYKIVLSGNVAGSEDLPGSTGLDLVLLSLNRQAEILGDVVSVASSAEVFGGLSFIKPHTIFTPDGPISHPPDSRSLEQRSEVVTELTVVDQLELDCLVYPRDVVPGNWVVNFSISVESLA